MRRLRSTIRTYSPLFEAERSAALEEELVWWAGVLGTVRDLDILGKRLAEQLADLPPELVVGPVARQIQAEIGVQHQAGWQEVLAALDSERYRSLVAELRRWRSETPFTDKADVPAEKVKKYVDKANMKLDKRLARAMAAYDEHDEEADEFFHSARKAGKRARYAVELALPEWGSKAEKIISDRKDLQDVLGEHQDSIVSATFLREQGVRMGIRRGTTASPTACCSPASRPAARPWVTSSSPSCPDRSSRPCRTRPIARQSSGWPPSARRTTGSRPSPRR